MIIKNIKFKNIESTLTWKNWWNWIWLYQHIPTIIKTKTSIQTLWSALTALIWWYYEWVLFGKFLWVRRDAVNNAWQLWEINPGGKLKCKVKKKLLENTAIWLDKMLSKNLQIFNGSINIDISWKFYLQTAL